MNKYVSGTVCRTGQSQPAGRHRRTMSDTEGSARLHIELHGERNQEVASDRRHVATPSRPLQPVGAIAGGRSLLDASLLDLLD